MIDIWAAVVAVNILLGAVALVAALGWVLCALPWLPRALREHRATRVRATRKEAKWPSHFTASGS